jgi:hypothetical protein
MEADARLQRGVEHRWIGVAMGQNIIGLVAPVAMGKAP